MPDEVISKVRIRLSNGKYKDNPVPIGANADNIVCYNNKPLSEVLDDVVTEFEVLENYLTRTKGLDGLDGRSIFVCYKRLEEDAAIVENYADLIKDGFYPSTYLMGIYLGYDKPQKESEYQFIRMGGEQGIQGEKGEKGDKGDRGEIGKPFTVKGTIDCTKGLKLENIILSPDDVGSAYYVYEIDKETGRTVTNLYLIGYPIEVEDKEEELPDISEEEEDIETLSEEDEVNEFDKVIKPIEENEIPQWLKIDSMKGESAYEIAKSTWADNRTENETSYEESLTAYGIWYWTSSDGEKEEVLGEIDATIPWYSDKNKKLWSDWNRGDSNYQSYLKQNPNSIFTNENMYLTSLKGDIIVGLSMNIDEEDKNTIKYTLNYKTYKTGIEVEDHYDGEVQLSGESLFYLENSSSVGTFPTYSLQQKVGVDDEGTVNANEVIGFNSIALGKGNKIKSSKEDPTNDEIKKIIANVALGDSNEITDAQGSAAAGVALLVSGIGQIGVGQYNEIDNNAQFIVGIGKDRNNRKNGFVVTREGNVSILGNVTCGGTIAAAAAKIKGNITLEKFISDTGTIVIDSNLETTDKKDLIIKGNIKAKELNIENKLTTTNLEVSGSLKVPKLEVTDDKTDLIYSGSITCDNIKNTLGKYYGTIEQKQIKNVSIPSSNTGIEGTYDQPGMGTNILCNAYIFNSSLIILSFDLLMNLQDDYWYRVDCKDIFKKYLDIENFKLINYDVNFYYRWYDIKTTYPKLKGTSGDGILIPVYNPEDKALYIGIDKPSTVAHGVSVYIMAEVL